MIAEIVKMRVGMWEKVAKRSHKPIQIYAFGEGADDVMLHGTVDYVLKDEKKVSTSWGARAHFTKDEDGLKMNFYQVYLVSSADIEAGVMCMLIHYCRIRVLWREPNKTYHMKTTHFAFYSPKAWSKVLRRKKMDQLNDPE